MPITDKSPHLLAAESVARQLINSWRISKNETRDLMVGRGGRVDSAPRQICKGVNHDG
jgi:hypothetical protein